MVAQLSVMPEESESSALLLKYVSVEQLCALGISRSTVTRKLKSREWKSSIKDNGMAGGRKREILVSCLPAELQLKWAQVNTCLGSVGLAGPGLADEPDALFEGHGKEFRRALLRLPQEDRIFWINEALRLARIVIQYGEIKPKRRRNVTTAGYEFVPQVHELCRAAACTDLRILFKEPHRQYTPSPYTLDKWWRTYSRLGVLTFFRGDKSLRPRASSKRDKRRAVISPGAIEWVNTNWRNFQSPAHLFKSLEEIAKLRGWRIPSESWVYRLWKDVPAIVMIPHLEGQKAYESKLAPFVPRDYSALAALQVLCGDHSQRDVTVLLPDGRTLARLWLTLWYDLRTGLIWGWHLGQEPSSHAAAMAYADGVQNYGAQPPSQPEQGFYSYVYTDHDRTYKSHNWDGKKLIVHEVVIGLDGSFEMLLKERRVGIVDEYQLGHLLARRYNAKEKPVEEVHKAISCWEQNTFDEYCGKNAAVRPEKWRKLYNQHLQFLKGKIEASPFVRADEYREALAQFIARYNSSEHKRGTLGGRLVVPVDEYHRLYTTRYELPPETLALSLMKAVKRKIGKDGVNLFQNGWWYMHEAMCAYKGKDVEVRYRDDDYSRVWVILPNYQICEAERITPSPFLNPDKQTLKNINKLRAHERVLARDYQFIAQSNIRGESIEDRAAQELLSICRNDTEESVTNNSSPPTQNVHCITRLDHLTEVLATKQVSVVEVTDAQADNSIFSAQEAYRIKEFDYDE